MEKSFIKDPSPVQVNRSLLERLISLAGELVLGRNQLLQGLNDSDMENIALSGQNIDLITSEIQDVIMQTRMQPVAALFEKVCRKFEDLVAFEKSKDVSLDRTILESVHEPLDALVEIFIKALQTGKEIENPDNRHIWLKAFQDAGQVNVAISSDTVLVEPSDIPEAITAAVEGLGGALEVSAIKDNGGRVSIKLPLTLAIIPSQIISIGQEKFIIPQANLSELLRVPAGQVKDKIEKVGDADVIRLRGEVLPLLNLSGLLGIEKQYISPENKTAMPDRRKNLADRRSRKYTPDGRRIGSEETRDKPDMLSRDQADRRRQGSGANHIAIVSSGHYKYGLVVDRFHDSEEIVVKPVGRHLQPYKAYAGATIMGDGKVSLILDILNLAQMAGLSTVPESNALSTSLVPEDVQEGHKESIALFKNMETEYFAAPFDHVQRIERFPTADIERIENQKVIQYRGKSLRLYEISQVANVSPLPEKELQEVIVFQVHGREFGLTVSGPVDILEIHLTVDEQSFQQKGIKGTMSINGHTTLVMDILEAAEVFWDKDKEV